MFSVVGGEGFFSFLTHTFGHAASLPFRAHKARIIDIFLLVSTRWPSRMKSVRDPTTKEEVIQ